MESRYKSIIEIDNDEAQDYLLKSSSYCKVQFPKYIDFTNVINHAQILIKKIL